MAVDHSSCELQTIGLTPDEVSEAQTLARKFKDVRSQDLRIKIETDDGLAVELPVGLVRLLRLVLDHASSGKPLSLSLHKSRHPHSLYACCGLEVCR